MPDEIQETRAHAYAEGVAQASDQARIWNVHVVDREPGRPMVTTNPAPDATAPAAPTGAWGYASVSR